MKNPFGSDVSPDDVFINKSAWELLSIVFLNFFSDVDNLCIFTRICTDLAKVIRPRIICQISFYV